VTEIPEHLLKRAQARRAALGGGGDAADAASPAPEAAAGAAPAAASAAPAKAKAAAPLPTLAEEPAKVKLDIPVVAAAKARKKVPFWIAPILLLLPIWGMVYDNSMTPAPKAETDPLVIGAEVFAKDCSGCHGTDGSGTAGGAQLNGGHAIATFADPLAMVHWVSYGYADGARDNGTYGETTIRQKIAGTMPAWHGTLSNEEIASVVIYIRSTLDKDAYDPSKEQGFTQENYEADPDALAAEVQAVIDLGPGGTPDTSGIERPGA
jgi:mono/diheme cytochrome c family protein